MAGLNLDLMAGQASVQAVKGIVAEMHAVIRNIEASAQTGLEGWRGQASNSFGATHTDWHGTAVGLRGALEEIETKLTTSFRGYDDDDAVAAGSIAGAGGLNL